MPALKPLLLLILLTACGEETAAPEPASSAEPSTEELTRREEPSVKVKARSAKAQDAFDPEGAYEQVCSTCHGERGRGDGPAGMALNPRAADFTTPEFWAERDQSHLRKVIKLGGASVGRSAAMAAYGAMYNDEQIAALATYLEEEFRPSE